LWRDGRIKLAVTRRLLAWRRSLRRVLENGDYRPLTVTGPHRDHAVAFVRVLGDEAAIVVVGRHFAPLTAGGRHWPRGAEWQGHVVFDGVLDGFSLVPANPDTQALALSAIFDPVPVATLRATRPSRDR
jgi:(1->4)-alpha-D-glucan 1-alpha-D-glucosylmutase